MSIETITLSTGEKISLKRLTVADFEDVLLGQAKHSIFLYCAKACDRTEEWFKALPIEDGMLILSHLNAHTTMMQEMSKLRNSGN